MKIKEEESCCLNNIKRECYDCGSKNTIIKDGILKCINCNSSFINGERV